MKRMDNDSLREKVGEALYRYCDGNDWAKLRPDEMAGVALAALGLDDLDAAVERMARAIHNTTEKEADRTFPLYEQYADDWNAQARDVLAALFARPGGFRCP